MNTFNQNPNMNMNMGMGPNMYPNMGYQNPMPSFNNINNLPRYSIVQVRGQNGAEAFQMGPNSKVLLLDETDPLIWFVQTDGAGYKTITPYSITPYQPAPQIDLNNLEERISVLEEKLNAKSYNTANKQRKQANRSEQSYVPVETTDATS